MQIQVRCRCNVQRSIDTASVGPWRLRCKQCGDVLFDPTQMAASAEVLPEVPDDWDAPAPAAQPTHAQRALAQQRAAQLAAQQHAAQQHAAQQHAAQQRALQAAQQQAARQAAQARAQQAAAQQAAAQQAAAQQAAAQAAAKQAAQQAQRAPATQRHRPAPPAIGAGAPPGPRIPDAPPLALDDGVNDSTFQKWLTGSQELNVMMSSEGEDAPRCARHPDRRIVAACAHCSQLLCKACLDKVGEEFVCAACIDRMARGGSGARPGVTGWFKRLLGGG